MSEAGAPEPPETPAPRKARLWVWLPGLVAVALIVFVAFDPIVEQFRHIVDVLSDVLGGNSPDQVGISVASPSVHTRERLLNDRFDQVTWLDELLKRTLPKAIEEDGGVTPEKAATASETAPADGSADSGGAPRANSSRRTEVTYGADDPRKPFELLNGYRDVLRSERASAMLDDRHDIDGNTLYLLTFDTSVIPRPDSRGFAAVEALVTRDPADIPNIAEVPGGLDAQRRMRAFQEQDTFDIYVNWLEKLRLLYQANVRNVEYAFNLSTLSLPPELEGLLPYEEASACAALLRDEKPSDEDPKAECSRLLEEDANPQPQSDASTALKDVRGLEESEKKIIDEKNKSEYLSQVVPYLSDYIRSVNGLIRLIEGKSTPGGKNDSTGGNSTNDIFVTDETKSRLQKIANHGSEQELYENFDEATKDCVNNLSVGSRVPPKDLDIYDLFRYLPPASTKWLYVGDEPGEKTFSASPSSAAPPKLRNYVQPSCPLAYKVSERIGFLSELTASFERNSKDLLPSVKSDVSSDQTIYSTISGLIKPFKLVEKNSNDDASCIVARWLSDRASQATAEAQRNHGSAITEFFDLSIRELGAGRCTLDVRPKVYSLRSEQAGGTAAPNDWSATVTKISDSINDTAGTQIHVDETDAFVNVASQANAAQWWIMAKSVTGHVFKTQLISVLPDATGGGGTLTVAQPMPAETWKGAAVFRSRYILPKAPPWLEFEYKPSSQPPDWSPPEDWWQVGTVDREPAVERTHMLLVTARCDHLIRWPSLRDRLTPIIITHGSESKPNLILEADIYDDADRCSFKDSLSYKFVLRDAVPADWNGATVTPGSTGQDLLARLQTRLDGPAYSERGDMPMTQAFSYGLSPRLRQTLDTRATQSGDATGSFFGAALHLGQSNNVAVESTEPEVVGFNRPSVEGDHAIAGARFGWLMTPRPDGPGSWQWSLPTQQVQLGAAVSVPSWWRSVLLQICTKFATRRGVADVVHPEFWSDPQRCHIEVLRLPGTATDVSRHLGMDIVSYPYVTPRQDPDTSQTIFPMVYANDRSRPASLLINGDRLWRSTVVTLGGQQADHIQVLPDMAGIVATFACVDVPTVRGASPILGDTRPDLQGYDVYDVPLVVWTSEGHSEDLHTDVAIAKPGQWELEQHPCYQPPK